MHNSGGGFDPPSAFGETYALVQRCKAETRTTTSKMAMQLSANNSMCSLRAKNGSCETAFSVSQVDTCAWNAVPGGDSDSSGTEELGNHPGSKNKKKHSGHRGQGSPAPPKLRPRLDLLQGSMVPKCSLKLPRTCTCNSPSYIPPLRTGMFLCLFQFVSCL